MRVKNSIKNMLYGIGSQLTSTIIAFLTRTIFIYILGAEYLGIGGLFSNILSILSLANLGMDSAIIFSLYEPIKENNQEEIKGYIDLYSKVYKIVGIVIFGMGLMLLPFVPNLVGNEIDIKENILIIYFLYLLESSMSYMYIYKQCVLIAGQQKYVISKIHTRLIVISNIVQICILCFSKRYIPVLAMQVGFRIVENIIISKKADKEYTFLKDKSIQGKLTRKNKEKLYRSVYSMFLYKISGTIINSTDNIVIAGLVGLNYVGLYSNYLLITSTIRTFTGYIFSALNAAVGNLVISDEEEKKEFIFLQILFTSFWIYGFYSISLLVLLNRFIIIWLGEEYLLNSFTVLLIVINFYTTGMQSASTIYRETTGLFNVGKYRPIIAAAINIVVSIMLAPYLGVAGVLLGTIISRLSVYFWFDPYVIYKYIFNKSVKGYYIKYIKYTVVLVISVYTTQKLCIFLTPSSKLGNFIVDVVICILIPNFMFLVVFYKNKHLNYLHNVFNSFVFSRIKNKTIK